MNKICNSQALLERAIPSIKSPQSTMYDRLEQFIENANRWVRNQFIGRVMFDKFEQLDEDVQNQLTFIVANKAFLDAIPSLDLVLTNQGFGVVQTTNVVPASKERVERLIERTKQNLSDAIDSLIQEMLVVDKLLEDFNQSPAFHLLTDSFFITAQDLATYAGVANPSRDNLKALSPKIAMCELYLKKLISVEYYEELLDKVRGNCLTAADSRVFPQFKRILGGNVQGKHNELQQYMDSVMKYIESNADLYPTYIQSDTFVNKAKGIFKNRKDASGHFF